jgi:AcrR family transcriptional regulator
MWAMAQPGTSSEPRWRRRKADRPGEIVRAALEVFAERGFAAARLEDVAARAGVSKAALYLYFATKADLFHAVVGQAVAPNLAPVRALAARADLPFVEVVPLILAQVARIAGASSIGGVAKMVIAESRNFPDQAKVWHDHVVAEGLAILAGVIERAQARGECRPGDARLQAFSILGPMVMGLLWGQVFTPVGGAPVEMGALADQHARTVLEGLVPPGRAAA